MTGTQDVDSYLAALPDEARARLEEVRRRARLLWPDAVETISYGIPTLKVDGHPVVHYAGFARHVSIFPITEPPAELEQAIGSRRGGRGTVKLSLAEPMPWDLVDRLLAFLASRHG